MESSCLGVWGFILKPRRARKLLETIDVYSGTREEESKALLSSNERLHQAPIYTTWNDAEDKRLDIIHTEFFDSES